MIDWLSPTLACRTRSLLPRRLFTWLSLCCALLAMHPAVAQENTPEAKPTAPVTEYWDAVYIQGGKVGYSRMQVTPIEEDGKQLLQHDATFKMTIKRLGQKLEMNMALQSVETPGGQVLRFRSEVELGPTPTVVTGKYDGGEMQMTISTLGKITRRAIPWSDEVRGFFFAEQSLERKPMKPGERRTFKALVPVFNQVATIDLVAEDYVETEMLDGPQRLLKIVNDTKFGPISIKSFVWSDDKGQSVKSLEPTMNQVSYRTTRDEALRDSELVPELLVGSFVKVKGKLSDVGSAREVVYRVTLKDEDPAKVFPQSAGQSVKSIDMHTAEIVVRRTRTGETESKSPASEKPGKADREPSNWIQSDNPAVVKLAKQAAPDEKDLTKIAVALERHVNRLITEKNFSTGLASAAEVAASREGDCTEHGVLLAALARARGIPARVVVGLVYVEPLKGFGYHMWTEVWLNGAWTPLDATRPHAGTGCGHIKIAHTNLSSGEGATVFLPVVQVLGKLAIEVVEVRCDAN